MDVPAGLRPQPDRRWMPGVQDAAFRYVKADRPVAAFIAGDRRGQNAFQGVVTMRACVVQDRIDPADGRLLGTVRERNTQRVARNLNSRAEADRLIRSVRLGLA